jgi:hypothetical protein
MRLLTHNQLVCVRKGCASHYPLQLQPTKVEKLSDDVQDEDDEEMDEAEELSAKLDFILHLLPNVDYSVLRTAANAVRYIHAHTDTYTRRTAIDGVSHCLVLLLTSCSFCSLCVGLVGCDRFT